MKRKTRRRKPVEVFLSHATADRVFADELAETLRQHGVAVWYSRTHLVGAQRWHDEIGKALERCDWFVVILSNNAIKSKWVQREVGYALWDDRFAYRIVPVLYRPCKPQKLSWTLPTFQYVDFTRGRQHGYHELLRIWGLRYVRR